MHVNFRPAHVALLHEVVRDGRAAIVGRGAPVKVARVGCDPGHADELWRVGPVHNADVSPAHRRPQFVGDLEGVLAGVRPLREGDLEDGHRPRRLDLDPLRGLHLIGICYA